MRSVLVHSGCVALLLILIAGCSSVTPLQNGDKLSLKEGQGLAAVIVDTAQPLRMFYLIPRETPALRMQVSSVPMGKTLYLFAVKAGTYCVGGFMYGRRAYQADYDELQCFAVPAGELGYSGVLMPLFADAHMFRLHVSYDTELFRNLLRQNYPKVAREYLPSFKPTFQPTRPADARAAEVRSAEESLSCNEQLAVCTWVKSSPDGRADAIFVKNNTNHPVWVWTMRLYECLNIKRECQVLIFNVKLPAHTARPFLLVKPRDPDLRFSYRYHLVWHSEPASVKVKKPARPD